MDISNNIKEINQNGLKLKIYPNVVKNLAIIEYSIANPNTYRLELIDNRGVNEQTIFNQFLYKGNFKMEWLVNQNLASGKYYLRLTGNSATIIISVFIAK